MRTSRLALPFALVASLVTATAHADEARPAAGASPDAAEVTRLHDELTLAARRARDARTAVAVTGIATGAALVPAGVVLARRSDDVSQSIGVGMTVGGGASLLFSLMSLRSSEMERFALSFETRRAPGVSNEELVRGVESDWASLAEASHRRRILGGWISVGLGTALTGAGLCMLLADPGVFGQSRNGQYTAGSLLVGPGVPILGIGIRALITETPEESSWTAYRAMKDEGARPALSVPALSFAPVRGGGVAAMTFTI